MKKEIKGKLKLKCQGKFNWEILKIGSECSQVVGVLNSSFMTLRT